MMKVISKTNITSINRRRRPEVIDLQINFDGTLLWNKTAVDRATIQGYISSKAVKQPQPEVLITVDKFSSTKSWRKPRRTCSIAA
jgi:biopolymer transport protein ExbD